MKETLEQDSGCWADGRDEAVLPAKVRLAFPALADAPMDTLAIRPLQGGLLHRTFHVRAGAEEYVLQRVSDVFAPEIHDNIDAVTNHLADRGFPTTKLLRTRDGDHSAALAGLGRWRLMTHLGGVSFERIESSDQAYAAGALVGRFHAAMDDFDAPLAPMGIPYRDTPRYLTSLRKAVDAHRNHRLTHEMSRLAERVFSAFETLGPATEVASRVIHGDLKIQNLLFEGRAEPARNHAFALIDLDTLMRAPLWVELGDAWRSWCKPSGEDSELSQFEMAFFEASARGFFEVDGFVLSESERESLETAPERVMLELCARYVTDALEECYFAWDDSRFPGSGEHNAARAGGQWNLYEAALALRADRSQILKSL